MDRKLKKIPLQKNPPLTQLSKPSSFELSVYKKCMCALLKIWQDSFTNWLKNQQTPMQNILKSFLKHNFQILYKM